MVDFLIVGHILLNPFIMLLVFIFCIESYVKKIFESYFSDRLTFSNIRDRTSRRIYRLALPPHSPETLSSLSKSTIFLFKVQHSLFCPLRLLNSIDKYRQLVY